MIIGENEARQNTLQFYTLMIDDESKVPQFIRMGMNDPLQKDENRPKVDDLKLVFSKS